MRFWKRLRPKVEVVLYVALGFFVSIVWDIWNKPPFDITDPVVLYDPERRRVSVSAVTLYRGGCTDIRVTQWIEHENTGRLVSLDNVAGKAPKERIAERKSYVYGVSVPRALEPGIWVWQAWLVCIRRNGSQIVYLAPNAQMWVSPTAGETM